MIGVKSNPIISRHIVRNDNDYHRTIMMNTEWVLSYQKYHSHNMRNVISSNRMWCNKIISYYIISYHIQSYHIRTDQIQYNTIQYNTIQYNRVQSDLYKYDNKKPLIAMKSHHISIIRKIQEKPNITNVCCTEQYDIDYQVNVNNYYTKLSLI